MSEAQIAAIVNDAVTRALARSADEVRTIVDDVVTNRRDELRGPAGRDGHDAPQGNGHWKSDDVGYFTPDPSSDAHVRTTKGTTYYLNVYAFINQLKALVPLKSEEVVRANLPSCLREAAARWYSAELSDEERQDLSVRSLPLGWYATLERRFKPRPTEALTKVMSPASIYSWRDVRAGRSVTEWAQNMLRDAQAADITGTTTLLRMVWTRLEPALQRDVREPTAATTISQFMADLDQRYGQWSEMSRRARPRQTQPQPARYQGQQQRQYGAPRYGYNRPSGPGFRAQLPFRPYNPNPGTDTPQLTWNPNRDTQQQRQPQWDVYVPPPNAPQAQGQRPSYAPQQQARPFQGQYQPRQQQQQQQPSRDLSRTNQAGQLLLSDKPWNQAGYSNTGYAARQPRTGTRPWGRPQAAAYMADSQEVSPPSDPPGQSDPPEANLADVAFYDGERFYVPQADAYYADDDYTSYAEYPPEEDPQAYWQAPPFPDDDDSQPCYNVVEDEAEPTVTCLHCSTTFMSNNKLHAHLKDCAPKRTAAAVDDETVAYYVSPPAADSPDALPQELPVITSDRPRTSQPGMAYKTWRYASTVVGLTNQQKLLVACLDTGCVMTIIDADLAKSLKLPLQKCTPVPVAGIGSRHLSSAFVSFDVYFRGADNAACVRVDAHLVENLKAKLLIGMDVMGHEGFRLDFDSKTVKIPSCMNLSVPISTHAKPHHAAQRAVYAAEHIVIPPRSIVRVPTRVQATLPEDRDYVFEGCHRHAAFYSHLVDANFAWVQAVNDTPEPVTVHRRDRIGTLYEADMPMACAVQPEVAELGRSPTDTAPAYEGLRHTHDDGVQLPNGVTLYAGLDPLQMQRLTDVLMTYDVWGEHPGVVNIPEDRWMTIPLVPGWESKLPKSKIYPLGPKDRAVVDEAFQPLHDQGKMSYTTQHTTTGFPVFVVWRTVHKPGREPERKGRAVVDLRPLNKVTERDVYPIPTMDDIILLTQGKRFITVLDAAKFLYQWRIRRDHRGRICVVSHRGQEMFHVAIMGFCNSVPYVQRQMDLLLKDLIDFCRAYLDDLVVASATFDEHLHHLGMVLDVLERHHVSLEPSKAYVAFPEVSLLGQVVDAFGMSTPEDKVKAIANLQFPVTLRQLETYLGMTGALRQYVPYYAQKSEPLQIRKTELLRGSPVKGRPRQEWSSRTRYTHPTERELAAFDAIQAVFQDPQWLVHWDRTRRLYFDIDSSQEGGHGAMVFHVKRDYNHTNLKAVPPSTAVEPIMFLSRLLTPAEKHYWSTELEVSCIVWVVRKIRHMIEAAPDDLTPVAYTDHIATINLATSLSSSSPDRMNLRLVRASQYLQQYRLLVYHKAGKLNCIADALSRLAAVDKAEPREDDDLDALHVTIASDLQLPGTATTWDVPDDAYAFLTSCIQLSDDFKTRIRAAYEHDPKWSLVLEELERIGRDPDPVKPRLPYEVDDGLLYSKQADGDFWLCVPDSIKSEIFEMAHGDGHLGFHRAWQKMRGFVVHKGAAKLRAYIDQCDECKKNAVPRHKPYGSLQPILAPPIPFHTLTIDFVGGLPRTKTGFDTVAIYTCKSTKRLGSTPGRKKWSGFDWATAILRDLQKGDWGVPVVWISDRDKKFVEGFWKGLFTALGTKLMYTAAYHPSADGQSERSNQTAEIWLRHWQNLHQDVGWDEGLPPMQASLNASVNASTGDTPHRLMFGVDLRMPWNFLRQAFVGSPHAARQDADECAKYAAMVMKKQYDNRHKPIFFKKDDSVYLKLQQGTDPGYVLPTRDITKKLTQRHIKCRVIERVGRLAYRLQFPPQFAGAHPVVSIEHLERAPKGGEMPPTQPPTTFDPRFPDDTDRADVDAVLDMRFRGRGRSRRKQYLVRWSAVGNEHLEWLDEDNLLGAEEKVLEYLRDVLRHEQDSNN
jgi:dUTPase